MYRVQSAEYTAYLERKLAGLETPPLLSESEESDSDEDEEQDFAPCQTFPMHRSEEDTIVRQGVLDLTCGMCALQNLYGSHIVHRKEMDATAKQLEEHAYGEIMYDPDTGNYSIEVLQSVLKTKGKYVQRVALEKIPAEYFVPTVSMNPTFKGYIVALESGPMRHYVAVRRKGDSFRLVDSIKGAKSQTIETEHLFQQRDDGKIYCSTVVGDQRVVVGVIAVGGSPFLEYTLLHDAWSEDMPSLQKCEQALQCVLQYSTKLTSRAPSDVKKWYALWTARRTAPSESCRAFLQTYLIEQMSGELSFVIKTEPDENGSQQQAVLRCSNAEDFVSKLCDMNWMPQQHWHAEQNGAILQNGEGDTFNASAKGSVLDYGMKPNMPIIIRVRTATASPLPQVGGFYTFHSKVDGTCVGNQKHAYSVRDTTGKVHIMYKHCIEKIDVTR